MLASRCWVRQEWRCYPIIQNGYLRPRKKILCTRSLSHWWGTSLVIQWLRIRLARQGTWVWSLLRELRSRMPQGNQACVLHLRSSWERQLKQKKTLVEPIWERQLASFCCFIRRFIYLLVFQPRAVSWDVPCPAFLLNCPGDLDPSFPLERSFRALQH